jgi:uncharacterized membrane protein
MSEADVSAVLKMSLADIVTMHTKLQKIRIQRNAIARTYYSKNKEKVIANVLERYHANKLLKNPPS